MRMSYGAEAGLMRAAYLRAVANPPDQPTREKRRATSALPPDEIDTMQEKAALFADQHPDEPLERPYDPGGLSELNGPEEHQKQASADGARSGK